MHKSLIILDTDIGTDCDDAGALAMLHALQSLGEAEILACTHSNSLTYGPACIELINNLCGHGDFPVGANKNRSFGEKEKSFDNYAGRLARAGGLAHKKTSDYPSAVNLMRQVLAGAADASVTMVGIGPISNFAALLKSKPDEFSPLGGESLVPLKVKELVLMAGFFKYDEFEKYSGHLNPNMGEYNVCQDIGAAKYVAENWPGSIVFSGFEIGFEIITGGALSAVFGADNLVRMAYESYGGRRFSWDQTAVLYAVRGAEPYWDLSEAGRVEVNEFGTTIFQADKNFNRRFLIQKLPPKELETVIDELVVRGIKQE